MEDKTSIRSYILSLEVPTVFRGMIDSWKMLSWPLERWTSVFGDKLLPFRCGVSQCSSCPRWERECGTKDMTVTEFFETAQSDKVLQGEEWFYFDYKYMQEWLKETDSESVSDLRNLSWDKFGFPEHTGLESTLWIGSRGAHTPCHQDTYGCNLVAQIHGSKQWIMFPPGESQSLRSSRVPYEESSIYSELNLNSPLNEPNCLHVDSAHVITLMPGDVLFVPHQWWHYVENLDVSISINTWLPLPSDNVTRVDEALVRLVVSQLCGDLTSDDTKFILNPNEDDIQTATIFDTLNVIDLCLKNVRSMKDTSTTSECLDIEGSCSKRMKFSSMDSTSYAPLPASLGVKEGSSKSVPRCTKEDLNCILKKKCKCISEECHIKKMESPRVQVVDGEKLQSSTLTAPIEMPKRIILLSRLINAFCNPNVISKVRDLLLKE